MIMRAGLRLAEHSGDGRDRTHIKAPRLPGPGCAANSASLSVCQCSGTGSNYEFPLGCALPLAVVIEALLVTICRGRGRAKSRESFNCKRSDDDGVDSLRIQCGPGRLSNLRRTVSP